MSKSSARVAAWMILLLWAAAFARLIVNPTLPVPIAIATPLALAAAGYLFGQDLRDTYRSTRKDETTP